MSETYLVGTRITLTATFTVGGTATDPTTVTFSIREPESAGTAIPYAWPGTIMDPSPIDHGGTGIFSLDVDLDTAGDWRWRAEGTGECKAPAEGTIVVLASEVL